MITLPRAAIARFRAVMRKSWSRVTVPSAVTIRSGSRGRGLEAVAPNLAIRLIVPGRGPAESLALQPDALDAVIGNDGEVILTASDGGQIAAAWENAEGAQHRQFPLAAEESVRAFPSVPRDLTPVDPSLLTALATAMPLAPKHASRYALQDLLLDGRSGRVVVTDSKVLLVQGRWEFSWKEQVLIPASPLWTCRELRDEPVAVGRTATQLVLTSGPWTVVVPIDKDGRYPTYAKIKPKANRVQNRVLFTDADCDLLHQQLPRLPSIDEDTHPVDLVTGPVVAIEGGDVRLPLPAATATGPAIRFNCDRRMLLRAIRLGFRELHIVTPTVPAVFHEANRQFVFMPLTPSENGSAIPAASSPQPLSEKPAMAARNATPEPSTNGHSNGTTDGATNGLAPDPLTEAEAVRGLLRDADTRMGRLVTYLKHHRRQSRALRSAMDSLRGLPELVQ